LNFTRRPTVTTPIKVIELCTEDKFFEQGYALYNPDIKAHVERGGSAALHYKEHGHREVRFQFTEQFLKRLDGSTGAERFKRYSEQLNLKRNGVNHLNKDGAFPVVVSGEHYENTDYSAESANDGFGPFFYDIADHPNKLFMDLGCGVRTELFDNCIYVEVYPSITADVIVGTDCTYPFPDNTFDGIGCFSVLEHMKDPWLASKEIYRMLKPGGRCYISWPHLAPVHGYPSHYFNATREGMKLAFSGGFVLEDCQSWHNQGPDHAIHWILHSLVSKLPPAEQAMLKEMSVGDFAAELPQGDMWKRILGALPATVIEELAAGSSLIARKV
jgi:SAM-dependent methyltransferase